MHININDLKSHEMVWSTIKEMGYSNESFSEWKNKYGKNNVTCFYVKGRLQSVFSLVSQDTGISYNEIEQYYSETFPFIKLLYRSDNYDKLANGAMMEVLDLGLRVPNIEKYLEKIKSSEKSMGRSLLELWHNYSPEEQKLAIYLLGGLFGVGYSNQIEREWKHIIDETDLITINNSFKTLKHSLSLDSQTKAKAVELLNILDVRSLSCKSLYEIIEHLINYYEQKEKNSRGYVVAKDVDTSINDLLLLIKVVLKYQLFSDYSEEIKNLQNQQTVLLDTVKQDLKHLANQHIFILDPTLLLADITAPDFPTNYDHNEHSEQ